MGTHCRGETKASVQRHFDVVVLQKNPSPQPSQAGRPQSLRGPLGWLESGYEHRRCIIVTKF